MINFGRIDNDDPTPLYYQIYKSLKCALTEGVLQVGSLLPTEKELEKTFAVSRVTIRKSVQMLESEGYVQKKAGLGTIVKDFRLTYRSQKAPSCLSLAIPGVKSRDIELIEEIPPKNVQTLLLLVEGETVYRLTRIRMFNGESIVYDRSYVIKRAPIKLTREMFNEDTSLYGLLEGMGLIIGDWDETLEARVPDVKMKRILDTTENDALFYRERVTFTKEGIPFEFNVSYYNAARTKYSISSGTYSHIIANTRGRMNE